MTKHTPGPWHIGMKPGPMIYGSKGEQVADLTARLLPDDETTGNARLIAAAPELLAALEDALDMLKTLEAHGVPVSTSGRAAMDRYQAAIAKATQSNI